MFQLPRTCRTFIILQPAVQWGWSEILTNKMVYLLEILVWQRSKDAQKKIPQHKPKPFQPEFMGGSQADPSEINKGIEIHTTDDIRSILDKPRL